MSKYRTISIQKGMYDEIQRIIDEHPELGYSSVTEFIKCAIRDVYFEIASEAMNKNKKDH